MKKEEKERYIEIRIIEIKIKKEGNIYESYNNV